MKGTALTATIMKRIARIEQHHLYQLFLFSVLTIGGLIAVASIALHRTVLLLLEKEVDIAIQDILKEEAEFSGYVKSSVLIWQEIEKSLLLVFVISVVGAIYVAWKTHITSYPSRFHALHKYLK